MFDTKRQFAAVILLILGSASAAAQEGDIARGRLVARDLCASCHAVERGDLNSRNTAAPAFSVIANTRGMSAPALNSYMHSSHETMPNIILQSDDRSDVLAYVLSLKD